MNWDLLKIFLAIAHAGSLAGASRELGVNHSTVFRRLNALEQALSGRVFERLSSGYELTPLGEELLTIAQGIEQGFNDLERKVVGKDVQPRGLVRITAANNLAYQYLPRYLVRFHERYPEIRTEIMVSNIEVNMNNRQADIAVRVSPAPAEHLVGREVRKLYWSVYGSERLYQLYGKPLDLKSLTNVPVISGSGSMRNLPAFQWVDKNLSENIVHRSDDLVTIAKLVEQGAGFSILPCDQRSAEIDEITPFEHAPPSRLWVLTHPELRKAERIRLVMQHLVDAFQNEPMLD